MKNIHVLPTKKPSILYAKDDNYKLANSTMAMDWYISSAGYKPYNICITSDVTDINENDYIITQDGRLVQVSYLLSKDLESASKVILTTDQDLIKDGVQAIDDEFLEWFVKNPSCEEVDIESMGFNEVPCIIYKIIIPQEEVKKLHEMPLAVNSVTMSCASKPKQVNTKQIMYNIGDVIEIINPTKNQPKLFKTHKVDIDFGVVYYYELNGKEETIGFSYIKKVEHKQETLEEAAEKWVFETNGHKWSNNDDTVGDNFASFIAGAKWQQEQDKNKFSEEDMEAAYNAEVQGWYEFDYFIKNYKKK